jgi:hypothetical protein
MSIRGSATRTKGPGRTIGFRGNLSTTDWAEFKARLRALAQRYKLKVTVSSGTKKKRMAA